MNFSVPPWLRDLRAPIQAMNKASRARRTLRVVAKGLRSKPCEGVIARTNLVRFFLPCPCLSG